MITLKDIREKIGASTIHSYGIDGKGIKVAVLDSGINPSHPLLNNSIISSSQHNNGNLNDFTGHGTHIASILLTVAPGVSIINIKTLDDQNRSKFSNTIQGIEQAVEFRADIINISSGIAFQCGKSHSLARLINKLNHEGFIFVSSAGNDGPSNEPFLPALADGCVAVGSVDKLGRLSSFSSKGPACGKVFPECVAFGEDIQAAGNDISGLKVISGTSQATPQVSGMLALVAQLMKRNPTRDEIEIILKNSCKRITSIEKDNETGWGLIQSDKAVSFARTFR